MDEQEPLTIEFQYTRDELRAASLHAVSRMPSHAAARATMLRAAGWAAGAGLLCLIVGLTPVPIFHWITCLILGVAFLAYSVHVLFARHNFANRVVANIEKKMGLLALSKTRFTLTGEGLWMDRVNSKLLLRPGAPTSVDAEAGWVYVSLRNGEALSVPACAFAGPAEAEAFAARVRKILLPDASAAPPTSPAPPHPPTAPGP